MMRPTLGGIAFAAIISGCASSSAGLHDAGSAAEPVARAAFAMHADAATLLSDWQPGFNGTADIGFESTRCCGLGFYISGRSLGGDEARAARVTQVIDGGLELGIFVPAFDDRLRLRARLGKAGTPPNSPRLGRSGYATSAALLVRILREDARVNAFTPNLDFVLGVSTLSLGHEHSAAGAVDDERISRSFLMLGFRMGAEFGLDLK